MMKTLKSHKSCRGDGDEAVPKGIHGVRPGKKKNYMSTTTSK